MTATPTSAMTALSNTGADDPLETARADFALREIESVILESPEVLEAYVSDVADPVRGQIVAAAVVLKPGQWLEHEDLRARLKSRLSAFELPKLIGFFEAGVLPYRADGKIDKTGLEALLADHLSGNRV